MLCPVYIHPGDDRHAHGMQFPDFPGCYSAADDWHDIPRLAQEAIECHMAGEDLPLPAATPLEALASRADYTGGAWMLVDIDISRLDSSPQRVNISLPLSLIAEVDHYARAAMR